MNSSAHPLPADGIERADSGAVGVTLEESGFSDVSRFVRHEFDILGSGWLRVYYGMTAPGFLGKNYSDVGMSWERLLAALPVGARERAVRLMAMARTLVADYEPIDWHIDLKTGFRSGLFPSNTIAYGQTEGVDLKVTGDMSRCYALPQLARAWQVTGNVRYRKEAIAQMLDWLAANPTGIGPGWRANMNVAIRAVNWVFALERLFVAGGAEDPTETEAKQLLDSCLIDHLHHIAANLEFSETQHHPNHYVANLVGLLTVTLKVGEADPSAKAWQRLAWRELRMEIGRRVAADGVDFEASTAYHAFVLEMLVVGLLCRSRALGNRRAAEHHAWLERELGGASVATLKKMFLVLASVTAPNGLLPLIGDSDSGRLLYLEQPKAGPRDWRFLNCLGAALFEDASLLPDGCESEHWSTAGLLIDHICPLAAGTERTDEAFPTTGFYVLRGGGGWAFVSAGPIGTAGRGGHDHNDRLALTLCVDDVEFLVDPGVFVYTASLPERNACRSVLAHNTVALDQQEPNRWLENSPWWGCHEDAHCQCVAWETSREISTFVGEHRGYHRLVPPVTHRRSIELRKRERRLTIVDDLTALGPGPIPSALWNFVLHPACRVEVGNDRGRITHQGKVLQFSADPGAWSLEETFYSPSYGIRETTKTLRLRHAPGVTRQSFVFAW